MRSWWGPALPWPTPTNWDPEPVLKKGGGGRQRGGHKGCVRGIKIETGEGDHQSTSWGHRERQGREQRDTREKDREEITSRQKSKDKMPRKGIA